MLVGLIFYENLDWGNGDDGNESAGTKLIQNSGGTKVIIFNRGPSLDQHRALYNL